jgi:hypothetical protein
MGHDGQEDSLNGEMWGISFESTDIQYRIEIEG